MIVINRCHGKYFLLGTEQSDFEFPLNVCKCSPTDLEEGKDVACCCLAPLMFLSGNGLAQKCSDVPDYDERVIFPNERRVKKTQVSFDFFSSAIKQLHVRVNWFYMLIRCYIVIKYRLMLALPTDAYHAYLTSNSFKRHASQSQPCIPCGPDFSGFSACCCTTYHILCLLDWSYIYSIACGNSFT